MLLKHVQLAQERGVSDDVPQRHLCRGVLLRILPGFDEGHQATQRPAVGTEAMNRLDVVGCGKERLATLLNSLCCFGNDGLKLLEGLPVVSDRSLCKPKEPCVALCELIVLRGCVCEMKL